MNAVRPTIMLAYYNAVTYLTIAHGLLRALLHMRIIIQTSLLGSYMRKSA